MSSPAHPAPHPRAPDDLAAQPAPGGLGGSRLPRAALAPDPSALPIGTRLGEFTIERVLGEGGFGIVYLAFDAALRRHVAIKEYMPATLARRLPDLQITVTDEQHRRVYDAGLDGFLSEARNLAQFDHPALVKVHRFWLANGTAYMVMPYYEGQTLKKVLTDAHEPVTEAWLMSLLDALTDALDVVHGQHFLHRDIAPDNILLRPPDGRPLLLDFGAARQVIGDATQRLTAILKPGYAPIEQYGEVASLRQGPWTDVYALCAVMYLAVAGRKPPPAVGRVVTDGFEPLAAMPLDSRFSLPFRQAIDQGLRVRPDERLSSMKALRVALGLPTGALLDAARRADETLDIPLEPDMPGLAAEATVDLPLDDLQPARLPEPPPLGLAQVRPAAGPPADADRITEPAPAHQRVQPASRPAASQHRHPHLQARGDRSSRWWWIAVAVVTAAAAAVAVWRHVKGSAPSPTQAAAPAAERSPIAGPAQTAQDRS